MQLLINQLQNISEENFHFFHFLIPFTLTMIVMPIGVKILTFYKIMDIPNSRKVHTDPIPSTGGILIFFCFLLSAILLIPFQSLIPAYIIGSSFLVFIGLMDDINPISPYVKFMTQILAGFIFISITKITFIIPGFENSIFISFIITLFFIVAVTNSLNLIDGMDGLASGISIIILTVISIQTGFQHSLLSIILISCIFGFLRANTFPAMIFMGDSGSYFLGYSIAIFILIMYNNTNINMLNIPIILGIPFIDTTWVFFKRLLNRQNIFTPDKNHIHHILQRFNIQHKNVVFLLYSIQGIFAILFLSINNSFHLSNFLPLLVIIPLSLQHIYLIFRDDIKSIKDFTGKLYHNVFKFIPWIKYVYIPFFIFNLCILYFILTKTSIELEKGHIYMIILSMICAFMFILDNNSGRTNNVSIGMILLTWLSFYFSKTEAYQLFPINPDIVLTLLGIGVLMSILGLFKTHHIFDSPTEYLTIILLSLIFLFPNIHELNRTGFHLIFLFLVYKVLLQSRLIKKYNIIYWINFISLCTLIIRNI
ncbi:MAG: undecaprenyl/decaprenyl-phosphate alpha-N-acetylglucosaminyl 1-phosphate transferase [Candidatus Marinimicrobia bacterium]|nr:undecaprenyl/decaprenyl-phosphate alpha-N-acetylglucosaminyl 1-phosphate transferase [Candidatus Neomarinimicrobiota bacterium]